MIITGPFLFGIFHGSHCLQPTAAFSMLCVFIRREAEQEPPSCLPSSASLKLYNAVLSQSYR